MAFDEFTRRRLEKIVSSFIEAHRPDAHMRKKLDLGFRIDGQSIEIFDIRPSWKHPEKLMELPVAKTTYVKSQKVWKIYWIRQDLKWHRYDRLPEVRTIEAFLNELSLDPSACFWC